MVCWLLLRHLLVAKARGRSANTAPFWIKAWWARERSATKTVEREPMRREMMGPYSAWSLRIIGSSSEADLRRNKKPSMMGKKRGPGGRLGLEMEVGRNRERRGLRRKETQRAMRTRNQVSMVNRKQSDKRATASAH
ncbi:hypothetical protein ACFX2A_001907 [Malus domestica]